MIVTEPTPWCDTTIIIVHHPLQSLHITEHKTTHILWVFVRIPRVCPTCPTLISIYRQLGQKRNTAKVPCNSPIPLIHLLLHWSIIPRIKPSTLIIIDNLGLLIFIQHPINSSLAFLILAPSSSSSSSSSSHSPSPATSPFIFCTSSGSGNGCSSAPRNCHVKTFWWSSLYSSHITDQCPSSTKVLMNWRSQAGNVFGMESLAERYRPADPFWFEPLDFVALADELGLFTEQTSS